MNVRMCRATAIIVQRVPDASIDWFLDWQRRAAEVVKQFEGYSGTDVYPPGPSRQNWVSVLHFADEPSLQCWLDSPDRMVLLHELRDRLGDFHMEQLTVGFGAWFADHSQAAELPPAWKMVLTVLLALYPTVMLLTIFVSPSTSPLGLAVSMLIGNAMSVSILQWALMPALTRLFSPWLNANGPQRTRITVAGLAVVTILLAGLTLGFRQTTG